MSTTQAPRRNPAVATQAPSAALQDKRPTTAKIAPESAFGAAVKNREVLGVGGMLALQAAAGNRAVAGLVQAKRERPTMEAPAVRPRGSRPMPEVGERIGVGGELDGELPSAADAPRARDAPGPATRGEPEAERPDDALPGLAVVSQARPGVQLPFRDHFERALGVDLGFVSARVAQRDALRPLGARAAAHGTHIDFFDEQPSRELVGHELVHVLQHLRGGAPAGGVSARGDAAEGEAEALGPRLGAGQFVAPRSRPAAALQLGRDENLELQWALEQRILNEMPKATFVALAVARFELIKDQVPACNMQAEAEAEWTAVLDTYKQVSRENDNLNKETPVYQALLDRLKADVVDRLTLSNPDTVRQRAANWAALKAFWPQATPLVLLQRRYQTLGHNKQARAQLEAAIPSEAATQQAMQGAWNAARQLEPRLVAKDLTLDAAAHHGEVIAEVQRKAARISPDQRAADYVQAMTELTNETRAALTPPAPAVVVARAKKIAGTPALSDLTAADVMKPDFDQQVAVREANAALRTEYLEWLAVKYPERDFVTSLLALYPKVSASRRLASDAATFYAEEMTRIREQVEAQPLSLEHAVYKARLRTIDTVLAEAAFDIPKQPRSYHSNTADENVEDQQQVLGLGLGHDDSVRVVNANATEAGCIRDYVLMHAMAKSSEHRVIIPIGPAPGLGQAAPRGRVTVSVDETGKATARLIERNPPTGANIAEAPQVTAQMQAALVQQFGLAGFATEGGAVWSTLELHKLTEALGLLPAADREAVAGITFVRAKSLDKAENDGRTLGLFTVRTVDRRIKLADAAFAGDALAFAGTNQPSATSAQTALHEVAHALEHKPQLDAQAKLAAVGPGPVPAFLNEELSRLEAAQPQAIAEMLRRNLLAVGIAVMGKGAGPAVHAVVAFKAVIEQLLKAPGEDSRAACPKALQDLRAQQDAIVKQFSADEIAQIAALKATAGKYVEALDKAPQLTEQLGSARADHQRKQKAHAAALETARKELAEASATDDEARSRRLQSFVDFVRHFEVPPTITEYAEKSWKEGKYGEFFAEAYALWLVDPQFVRRNFQPLFVYFDTGKHR